MAKTDKVGATPRLRFPEFRDSGEWRVERMDRLYSFMPTNSYSRDKLNYEYGAAKNVHYGDIHTKFPALLDVSRERIPYINGSEALPEPGFEGYCREGDLLFADASEDLNDVGKCIEIVRLNGEPLLSGQHTILARRDDGRLVVGFGGHLFRSEGIRSQVRKEAQGTKVYGISPRRLANIDVAYPVDDSEQQKIADCLSSLDDVIAAQAQKVKALKVHKQGLMQQLFPRDGETVPQLRFPEFRDAPEWRVSVFGDFVARSFYGTSSPTSETGRYPVLRMGNMVDGDLDLSRLVYMNMDRESFEAIRLRSGDILLNRTNSPDLVGKISIFNLDVECIAASYIVTYRLHEERLDPSFCNFLLNTPLYRAKIKLLARPSVSQANINPTTFRNELTVCVPSLAEQQRIASCLSSLQTRITSESERLDVLRSHKAALMQQLFPSASA
jgi:type I restriction enzyme, S subunit